MRQCKTSKNGLSVSLSLAVGNGLSLISLENGDTNCWGQTGVWHSPKFWAAEWEYTPITMC